MPRRRRKRGSSVEKFLPLGYFGVAIACAVLLLPSALRPPSQQPNQTAELSPNAPPDKNQAAIIGSLQRATSGVAAAPATGTGPAGPTTTTTAPPPPPAQTPTVTVPRACPHGFGNPPRQVESVYAPPCAAPWSGTNNGGATWKGVTATEIRIGVRGLADLNGGDGDCDRDGSVDDLVNGGDVNGNVKTWYNLEQYFNKNFMLYGRRLSFYCIEPTTQSVTDEENEAVAADEQYHIFGSGWNYSETCVELARRQIVSMCPELADSWYNQYDPYIWSAWPSGTDIVTFESELICKQLAGKPAQWAGDDIYKKTTRRFGLVTWDDRGYGADARLLTQQVKQECGVNVDMYFMHPGAYWGGSASGDQEVANAVLSAKTNGDTTMLLGEDSIDGATVTNEASAQQYSPEWIISDGGALDTNGAGSIMNPSEWAHSFGISGFGPDLPVVARECDKAFFSIDPSDTPAYWTCELEWVDLMLLIGGIQQAGPNLTPTTFKSGLQSLGMRYWPLSWAQGGGFGGGRHTYPNNVEFIWWNPNAPDPSAQSAVGALMYLNNGKRYCHGQLPSEPVPFFQGGTPLPTDFSAVPVNPPSPSCT